MKKQKKKICECVKYGNPTNCHYFGCLLAQCGYCAEMLLELSKNPLTRIYVDGCKD